MHRGDMSTAIVPDLTLPHHQRVVRENTLGWLYLTPRPFGRLPSRPQIGFAFDNTGIESTRDTLIALLEAGNVFGTGVRVFVSGEAIPHDPVACRQAALLHE